MDTMTTTERLFDIDPERARVLAQSLHRKKEDFQVIRKSFAADKIETVESEHAVISYITTKSIDRDGEVLLPEGMIGSVYDKSGRPVFWGHQYGDPDFVIGQNIWYKADPTGAGIIAKTVFRNTEFADKVHRLYTEDIAGLGPVLKGWSVGFIPLEWEDGNTKGGGPRRTYTKWELLEYSTAPLQSNRDALTIACQKGMVTESMKKDMGVVDPEPIILTHVIDPCPHPIPDIETKTDGATQPEINFCGQCGTAVGMTGDSTVFNESIEAAADAVDEIPVSYSEFKALIVGQTNMTMAIFAKVGKLADEIVDIKLDMESLKFPMPSRAIPEPDITEPPCTFADLKAAVKEITERIESIKAAPVAPISASVETVPVVEAPLPEPVKSMTPAELRAAVVEAVKGLDIAAIFKSETTLALSKLKGRVTG